MWLCGLLRDVSLRMVVGRKTPNTHPHGLSPPLVFPHLFDRTARAGYTLLFRRGFWNGGNWRLREKRVTSWQERQTALSFLCDIFLFQFDVWQGTTWSTESWSHWRAKFREVSLPTIRETKHTDMSYTHRHLAWLRWAISCLIVGHFLNLALQWLQDSVDHFLSDLWCCLCTFMINFK